MEHYALAVVTWVDSVAGSEWLGIAALKESKPATIKSVGWVVDFTEDNLILAAHISEAGWVKGDMVIPVCAILEIDIFD